MLCEITRSSTSGVKQTFIKYQEGNDTTGGDVRADSTFGND